MKTFQELLAEFKMNEAKTELLFAMSRMHAGLSKVLEVKK